MKLLPFYQVENWMIIHFGWGKHLGAYCLIYSFYRSGRACSYSKAQFAEFLQCSRMQAIRVLNDLSDGEYIQGVITPGSSTVYHINEEKAQELKQSSSNIDVTGGSNIDVTQLKNILKNEKEKILEKQANALLSGKQKKTHLQRYDFMQMHNPDELI